VPSLITAVYLYKTKESHIKKDKIIMHHLKTHFLLFLDVTPCSTVGRILLPASLGYCSTLKTEEGNSSTRPRTHNVQQHKSHIYPYSCRDIKRLFAYTLLSLNYVTLF
jgi:hypothetical protein